jgi:hypothetical protein
MNALNRTGVESILNLNNDGTAAENSIKSNGSKDTSAYKPSTSHALDLSWLLTRGHDKVRQYHGLSRKVHQWVSKIDENRSKTGGAVDILSARCSPTELSTKGVSCT